MSQATYLVELCCDGWVLESVPVQADGPRHATCVFLSAGDGPFNPEEDYFRVVDPDGGEWFWQLRGGELVRLLRPPVPG